MKKSNLTADEIQKRFDEIDAREPEEPTPEDLIALEAASSEDEDEIVSLEEYKTQKEYSGKLLLRIPKELHRELADAAKNNGVSLNQYAVYKLAKR